jgi:hypothetical protein
MSDQPTFAALDDAQLHYLKAQYLASLQLVDQAEAGLRAQLDQIGKTRKQITELMAELDAQLGAGAPAGGPAKPTRKPVGKPTPRRSPRKRAPTA